MRATLFIERLGPWLVLPGLDLDVPTPVFPTFRSDFISFAYHGLVGVHTYIRSAEKAAALGIDEATGVIFTLGHVRADRHSAFDQLVGHEVALLRQSLYRDWNGRSVISGTAFLTDTEISELQQRLQNSAEEEHTFLNQSPGQGWLFCDVNGKCL